MNRGLVASRKSVPPAGRFVPESNSVADLSREQRRKVEGLARRKGLDLYTMSADTTQRLIEEADETADAQRQPKAGFEGLVDRKALAESFPGVGVCERTIIRWERLADDPLPVIKVGKLRLYDLSAVRAWILRRQEKRDELPKLGRPAKRRAA